MIGYSQQMLSIRSTVLFICITLTFNVFAQQKEIRIGDDASHYRLKVVTSKNKIEEKPIADLKGSIIIMQWMTNGCSGSKVQLKEMNSYYKKYSNDVSFYAIVDDPISMITSFKAKNNYTFNFCQDKGKMENKFFYFTAGSHMVIINRQGICLYRGSPSILSSDVVDTLIARDHLSTVFQKNAINSFNLKEYSYGFEEYTSSIERYDQTGFKLEPYKSSLITTSKFAKGKYFYGYNLPVYSIYRDGLLLNDARISISDPLKQKLNSQDTSNLYMVGFNINKKSGYNNRYRRVFKNYLDSAFGLTTKLTRNKEDVIVIRGINLQGNINRTTDYQGKSEVRMDTLLLKNVYLLNLAASLRNHLGPVIINTSGLDNIPYDIKLVLSKEITDKQEIVKQLNKQGIKAKVEQAKISSLEFLDENETSPVTYLHTRKKQTMLKFGYKIGYGKSQYVFGNKDYTGKKVFAFKGSLFAQMKLNNHLALQPEINYLSNGDKGNYATTRLHSINTPFNILLTTNQEHPIGLYIKAGAYYSCNFAGHTIGKDFNTIEKNIFGSTYGFGVRVGGRTTLEFTYNRGLTNSIKDNTVGNVRERSSFINLGFGF